MRARDMAGRAAGTLLPNFTPRQERDGVMRGGVRKKGGRAVLIIYDHLLSCDVTSADHRAGVKQDKFKGRIFS